MQGICFPQLVETMLLGLSMTVQIHAHEFFRHCFEV